MATGSDFRYLSPNAHESTGITTFGHRNITKRKRSSRLSLVDVSRLIQPTLMEEEESFRPSLSRSEEVQDFIVLELAERERLVRLYPYEIGIQIIREKLREEFPYRSLDDLMNVLYNLIENKENALGVGDYGDNFAPWRSDHFKRLSEQLIPSLAHNELSYLSKSPSSLLPSYISSPAESYGAQSAQARRGEVGISANMFPTSEKITPRKLSKSRPAMAQELQSPSITPGPVVGLSERPKCETDSIPEDQKIISCRGLIPNMTSALKSLRRVVTLTEKHPDPVVVSATPCKLTIDYCTRQEQQRRGALREKCSSKDNHDTLKIPPGHLIQRHQPTDNSLGLQLDGGLDSDSFDSSISTSSRKLAEEAVVNGNRPRCVHNQTTFGNQNASHTATIDFSQQDFFCKSKPRKEHIYNSSTQTAQNQNHNPISTSTSHKWRCAQSLFEHARNELIRGVTLKKMNSSANQDFVDPPKYDPGDRHLPRSKHSEDTFEKYRSISEQNPFARPSFRETLAAKESHFPKLDSPQSLLQNRKKTKVGDLGASRPLESTLNDGSPIRMYRSSSTIMGASNQEALSKIISHDNVENFGLGICDSSVNSESDSKAIPRRRRNSEPLSPTLNIFDTQEPEAPMVTKAKTQAKARTIGNVPHSMFGQRPNLPKAISTSFDFYRTKLAPISEQQYDLARNYKVKVREGVNRNKTVVRSPRKKMFGEHGILGRTGNMKDLPDPRYKRTALAVWTEKLRQFTDDVKTHFNETKTQTECRGQSQVLPRAASITPISLSIYSQGEFYMQLEMLLNTETNHFLLRQLEKGNLSVKSMENVVEYWRSKGRPQVIEFRYDFSTQRDLVQMNSENMDFSGINPFNQIKVQCVLAAWRVMAKEMSIRTFCHPDRVVKKHLHDAETVLNLIDASSESMLAFEELRSRILNEISHEDNSLSENMV